MQDPTLRAHHLDRTGRERDAAKGLQWIVGLLLIAAGWFTWVMLSERHVLVPAMWQHVRGEHASGELHAVLRSSGSEQGRLLKLEWAAHPNAESYLVEFEGAHGFRKGPFPAAGNVFLYDLTTNVFDLPKNFRWTVTAVLHDGTQVAGASAYFRGSNQR